MGRVRPSRRMRARKFRIRPICPSDCSLWRASICCRRCAIPNASGLQLRAQRAGTATPTTICARGQQSDPLRHSRPGLHLSVLVGQRGRASEDLLRRRDHAHASTARCRIFSRQGRAVRRAHCRAQERRLVLLLPHALPEELPHRSDRSRRACTTMSQYQLYPDGTPIKTFTPRALRGGSRRTWIRSSRSGTTWATIPRTFSPDSVKKMHGKLALKPRASKRFPTSRGAGEDRRPASEGDACRPARALRQTVLRVYWDNAKKPGIEAPGRRFLRHRVRRSAL